MYFLNQRKNSHCIWILLCFLAFFNQTAHSANYVDDDFSSYHRTIIEAETAIANQEYTKALIHYKQVFEKYDFVFLRDYQIATQLALHMGKTDEAFAYLKRGIASGWTMKSIRKHRFLTVLRTHSGWKNVEQHYDSLHGVYQNRIDAGLRTSVEKMFKKDQWKALGALFTLGSKAQARYAEKRFAPQSERQLTQLHQLINTYGYPGEQLIGNNYWVSTILSHHNSISVPYTQNDTQYPAIKPLLIQAIRTGQMSPYEFAIIENWYIAILSGQRSYGYLGTLTKKELIQANQLRNQIGLRSVETRNRLFDIQQQTGMDFHLPGRPQLNGKIGIIE